MSTTYGGRHLEPTKTLPLVCVCVCVCVCGVCVVCGIMMHIMSDMVLANATCH